MSTQKVDAFVEIVDALHNDDLVSFFLFMQETRKNLPGNQSFARHMPGGKNHAQSAPIIFRHLAFPATDNFTHESELRGHAVVSVLHECMRQARSESFEFFPRDTALVLDLTNEIVRGIDNSILAIAQVRVQLSRYQGSPGLSGLLLQI